MPRKGGKRVSFQMISSIGDHFSYYSFCRRKPEPMWKLLLLRELKDLLEQPKIIFQEVLLLAQPK
jgi:hypothetical protein